MRQENELHKEALAMQKAVERKNNIIPCKPVKPAWWKEQDSDKAWIKDMSKRLNLRELL